VISSEDLQYLMKNVFDMDKEKILKLLNTNSCCGDESSVISFGK